MYFKKILSMFLVILLFVTLIGCRSETIVKIYMVPHSISTKAFNNETKLNLFFVSNFMIEDIDQFFLPMVFYNYNSIESYSIDELNEIEEYQGYYIYQLLVNIEGVEGHVEINDIHLMVNEKDYIFETDIIINSETRKTNHITSGTNEGPIIFPGYQDGGLDFVLSPQDTMTIKRIYFENLSGINLNNYIDKIIVNNKNFDGDLFLESTDTFSLEITFNDEIPYDTYVVDQLMVDYRDEDNDLLDAYILAPLYLGSPVSASRHHIDYLISHNEESQ